MFKAWRLILLAKKGVSYLLRVSPFGGAHLLIVRWRTVEAVIKSEIAGERAEQEVDFVAGHELNVLPDA